MKFVEKAVYPGGGLKIREAEAPQFEPMSRRTIEEGLDEENFTDNIVEHVRTGASMCVLGGAGTGKSVCLRRVRSALQEQGLQVACVSLTHCAACNVDRCRSR